MEKRRPWIWAVVAMLTALVPLSPGLSGSRVFYIRDLSLFFWGRYLWLRHAWQAGEFPLWDPYVGGGQAHPPRPRDWSYRPPRQVRIGALKSALSKFHKEGRLVVVDAFEMKEIKTKAVMSALASLKTQRHALVVDSADNEKLRISIRNCKDHQFLPPEGVNVYDLLRHDTLVLSKDAAKKLEERCLSKEAAVAPAAKASAKKGGAK